MCWEHMCRLQKRSIKSETPPWVAVRQIRDISSVSGRSLKAVGYLALSKNAATSISLPSFRLGQLARNLGPSAPCLGAISNSSRVTSQKPYSEAADGYAPLHPRRKCTQNKRLNGKQVNVTLYKQRFSAESQVARALMWDTARPDTGEIGSARLHRNDDESVDRHRYLRYVCIIHYGSVKIWKQ